MLISGNLSEVFNTGSGPARVTLAVVIRNDVELLPSFILLPELSLCLPLPGRRDVDFLPTLVYRGIWVQYTPGRSYTQLSSISWIFPNPPRTTNRSAAHSEQRYA